MQTWSVGILCYNEAETLGKVVADLRSVLTQLTDTFEILIVDDCSTDGSGKIGLELEQKYADVRLVQHKVNKGIGGTLRSIYTNAQYENVGICPADGQFDVKEYLIYPDIPENHFVCFYRKENTYYSLFRNILSYLNKKLNQTFIGINMKDVNWAKVYKTGDLAHLDLQLTSSLIESEICAKLIFLGKTAIEVESKYLPRTYGVSKGGSAAILKKAIKDTLVLIAIMRKFRKAKKKGL